MRRLRFAAETAAFAALLQMARVVPVSCLARAGAVLGTVAGRLDRRHTRIARDNLALAFGDALDPGEARRIVRACWRHFGRITLEALAFPRLDARRIDAVIRFEGLEHVRTAYAAGRGVLVFSGHFGHWELVALAQGHLGLPLALVTRPLDNPRLETMLARLRSGSGNLVIHKRTAVREMMRALGRGLGIAIVIDQDARDAGVFVPFFGRLASTTPTLALVALRTGAPIVPVFSYPDPDGRWRVVYDPAIPAESTGDRAADVLRVTAACTAAIERRVRERPELWLWMHRRWKTRPPEGAS